jgi:nicotinamide-nucleotide adenylyltransferase
MAKRALFVFDWQRLTEQHLAFIITQAERYDELIFLVDRSEEFGKPLHAGELLTALKSIFSLRLDKPYYLFPVIGKGMPVLYHWLRWRILCPAFSVVYIDNPIIQTQLQHVLKTTVEVFSPKDRDPLLLSARQATRGLFIKRAQPFHLGHAAFIQQMEQEVEEAIIVVAMANRSHQPADIATAGERVEMIQPWLQAVIPQRHYLIPLPYSDFTMENLYELEYLLPSFEYIYTSNPTIMAMADTAHYFVRQLHKNIDVSSTMIRDCILKDQPYREYLPESVYNYLQRSDIPGRIKKLEEKEKR